MGDRRLLRMMLIGVVASIVGVAIALQINWFPVQASTAAHKIDTLYDVLLIASVPVFVLVMTVAIYSVITFRAKPGDMSDGAPIHGNTRLEVVWVTIPFLMVTGLAVYGWIVLHDIEAKKPDALVVNVTGRQFAWSFDYPQSKVQAPTLVVPEGRQVEFRVKTMDVIHSFWVPEFRLKTDTVPGLTTKIHVTPTRLGRYDIVCAELCGVGHSLMRNSVQVVPKAQFARWLVQRKQVSAGAGGPAQQTTNGKQLFAANGCNACHTLADAGATGTVGPNLNNLSAMAAKYGKQQHQTPEQYVRQSIEDPNAFVVPGFPKNTMPATFKQQLSAAEIDALVKYLLSVSGGSGR